MYCYPQRTVTATVPVVIVMETAVMNARTQIPTILGQIPTNQGQIRSPVPPTKKVSHSIRKILYNT